MEPLDYNLLFRWFVSLSMDKRVWDATMDSKNRDRLVGGDVAAHFLQARYRARGFAGFCRTSAFRSTAR